MINVVKKNGTFEEFNIGKIKNAIQLACEGLDVSPLALESKFDQFIFDGITTQSIHENLIEHAKQLCSASQSDWVYVAGRLATMLHWSNTRSYDTTFINFFNKQIEYGVWKHQGFKVWSKKEIVELGEHIVKDRDLAHSFASVVTAKTKYLLPNECIQHMFMGNAMIIASVELPEHRLQFAKEVYDALSERKISLATPWLSGLRNGGNISSCFIIEPNDSLDSIYKALWDAAKISKAGGGLGVSLGRLRAAGSDLMGIADRAGGIVGWTKLFNDTAVTVNQAGKRKGAFTLAVPIWHKDVGDFLDVQTEAGDQRKKSYDIKPQIVIQDLFMKLKDNAKNKWHTFCPHEVKTKLGISLNDVFGDDFVTAYDECVEAYKQGVLKVVTIHKAKELFIRIMKNQFETGMPYLTFSDTLNEGNPNPHVGNIPCFNLCTESSSVVIPDHLAHTCNLASLVVGRIPKSEIPKYAGLAARILDNGISLTNPPIELSKAHNDLLRTVGIGIQGYHDYVAINGLSYTDTNAATELAEIIQFGAVTASVELAVQRGAYPAFKGSRWEDGSIIDRYIENSVADLDWENLKIAVQKYGIRNSQLTSPAPNTSTSIFMDAAAGVMPVYSAFFYEDNGDGVLPVGSMHLKENPLSYMRNITAYKPWELTKMVGGMQKFVDTGISAEYIMDKNQEDLTAKWLWDTIQAAWKNKTKAVYYIRTVKKGESLAKEGEDCAACAG